MAETTETALDRLMDFAWDRSVVIVWGRRNGLYTVTLDGGGAPYHHSCVGETREEAAAALLHFIFNK